MLPAPDFVRQEVEHPWAIKVGHPVLSLISIVSRVLKIYLYTLAHWANQGSRFLFRGTRLALTLSSLVALPLPLLLIVVIFPCMLCMQSSLFPLLFFDISVLHNRDPRPSFGRMMGHLLMNRMFSRNHQGFRSVVAQTRPQALKQDLHYNNDSDFCEGESSISEKPSNSDQDGKDDGL